MILKKNKIKKSSKRYLLKNCCWCKKEITVNYNVGTNEYIKKNDLYYWTEKEENKDKYICNSCLLNFYYEKPKEYLKEVSNKKKRRIFTTYVYNGAIS